MKDPTMKEAIELISMYSRDDGPLEFSVPLAVSTAIKCILDDPPGFLLEVDNAKLARRQG